MNLKNKKIGVWGYGITGQSIVRYLLTQNCKISILESKSLFSDQLNFLYHNNITVYPESQISYFFQHNFCVIPSPGIDLTYHKEYQEKITTETDLFFATCKLPTIAITGSVGKTSIVTLLPQLLAHNDLHAIAVGNNGTAMLDHAVRTDLDCIVVELSSYQLQCCSILAPDIAVITNLHENHLDRHKTMDNYWQAKYNLIKRQVSTHCAILPLSLLSRVNHDYPIASQRIFFSETQPTPEQQTQIQKTDILIFIDKGQVFAQQNNHKTPLIRTHKLPDISITENWLILIAILYRKNISLDTIFQNLTPTSICLPAHRLERVVTINGIDFYNDSKSTTCASTLSALQKLTPLNRPIHLLLGGLDKGVDRSPLIEKIKSYQKIQVHCFGYQAAHLYTLCTNLTVPATCNSSLKRAFDTVTGIMRFGDIVLLSPAGGSFDEFDNFEKRGDFFKSLILAIDSSPNYKGLPSIKYSA